MDYSSTATEHTSQTKYMKVQTALLAAILLLILACVLFVVTQFGSLHRSVTALEKGVQRIDVAEINAAVASMKEAANSLNAVDISSLNDTVVSLKDAAENLKSVDIETLNRAVASLREAADTLKELDTESLNSLVGSLETVASRLESAVNAVGGIFRR